MEKINVVVIGSGGREHALSWKLSQSPKAGTVYTIPGNAGIPNSVDIPLTQFSGLQTFCENNKVSLIVVGPEAILSQGIADYFSGSGIKVCGPDKFAAQLESSKIFSKEFMVRNGVMTPKYRKLTPPYTEQDLYDALAPFGDKVVIKFDGLAAGKGVYVCHSKTAIENAIGDIKSRYGDVAPLVIEQLLVGPELSIIGLTDGKDIRLFPVSQDHKRVLDGDAGLNTGGMGAYTPVKICTDDVYKKIISTIIEPTLQGLQKEKITYNGFLYFGILLELEVPYLLEYNARLGDPETEVILPALETDLLEAILLSFDGKLSKVDFVFNDKQFVDVVLCSAGYPGEYKTGKEITGLENVSDDVTVFHSATVRKGDSLVTNGGRVLNIVGKGKSFFEARDAAYKACEKISFDGKFYRHDIGKKN
jgi:phosphoribosylamine---glycine ligase